MRASTISAGSAPPSAQSASRPLSHPCGPPRLRDEGELIAEGKITDPARIEDYEKRTGLVAKLRKEHLIRAKDAKEASIEITNKSDVEEALEWLRRHKEKEANTALKLMKRQEEGEEVEVEEEEPEPDDPDIEVFICEPPPLRGM
jgi:hypothetical protein